MSRLTSAATINFWRRNSFDRIERPMRFVFRALFDPFANQCDFRGADFQMTFRRRHLLVGIGTRDAANDFALLRFAGNDGARTGFFIANGNGIFQNVEAQIRFATFRVRPVTLETTVGEERANLKIEVNRLLRFSRGKARREHERVEQDKKSSGHERILAKLRCARNSFPERKNISRYSATAAFALFAFFRGSPVQSGFGVGMMAFTSLRHAAS